MANIWVRYNLSVSPGSYDPGTPSYNTNIGGYSVHVYIPYADPYFLPNTPEEFIERGSGPYFELSSLSYFADTSTSQPVYYNYSATASAVSLTKPVEDVPALISIPGFNGTGDGTYYDHVWRQQYVVGTPLFTEGNDSVDFNSLSDINKSSILDLASGSGAINKTLGGNDQITLPSYSTLLRYANSNSSDDKAIYNQLSLLSSSPISTAAGNSTVIGSDRSAFVVGVGSITNNGESGNKIIKSGTGDLRVLFPDDLSHYHISYNAKDLLSGNAQILPKIVNFDGTGSDTIDSGVTAVFQDSSSIYIVDYNELQTVAQLRFVNDGLKKTFGALAFLPGAQEVALGGGLVTLMIDSIADAKEASLANNGGHALFVKSVDLLIDADRLALKDSIGNNDKASKGIDSAIEGFKSYFHQHSLEVYNTLSGKSGVPNISEISNELSKTVNDYSKESILYNDSFVPTDTVPILQQIPSVKGTTLDVNSISNDLRQAGLASDSLFDGKYYVLNNGDVLQANLQASTHYAQYGWHEGRDPNADFSTNGYLAANQDVSKAGINPLAHYDQYGWKEGRDPSASFDNELYLAHNPDVKAASLDPLAHYLQYGQAEGRQAYAAIGRASDFTHGSFDAEYYLLANPDIAKLALASGGDTFAFAYQHYQSYGAKEGRMADAYFDSAYYLAHNADVAALGINPLTHYDTYGWKEGRDPSAAFHTNAYLAANPDVAAAHLDPLQHYLQYGALEGRHLA